MGTHTRADMLLQASDRKVQDTRLGRCFLLAYLLCVADYTLGSSTKSHGILFSDFVGMQSTFFQEGGHTGYETFKPEDIKNYVDVATSQEGLPKQFEGIWWMDGNPGGQVQLVIDSRTHHTDFHTPHPTSHQHKCKQACLIPPTGGVLCSL